MEIVVTEVNPFKKDVKITVPREEIQKDYNDKLEEVRRHAQIKGYRPGRASKNIVERKYGKSILQELKVSFIVKAYEQTLEENNIVPIREPEIKEEEIAFSKDEDCEISFNLDVFPDFELPEYKGLDVLSQPIEVTDDEMKTAETEICKMRGELVVVEDENATIKEGDVVICSFAFKIGNETIWSKENFLLEAVDLKVMNVVLKKELLLNHKVGDVCEEEVVFPEDFKLEEHKNKQGKISITITELKRVQLPELTDDFARELNYKDADDMREKIREQIHIRKEANNHYIIEKQLIDNLVNATEMPLPEEFIQERITRVNANMRNKLKQENKSDEEIDKIIADGSDEMKQEVIYQLKEYLLVEKIAGLEKIEVKDEEIDEYINAIAAQTRQWPNEVRKEYEQKGLIDELKYQAKMRKVLEFMRENAKISEAKQ